MKSKLIMKKVRKANKSTAVLKENIKRDVEIDMMYVT